MKIIALIPSISVANIQASMSWIRQLSEWGVRPVIVANAASVAAMDIPHGVSLWDSCSNPGFARSLTRALQAESDWDWVILLNDDLIFEDSTVSRMMVELSNAEERRQGLILFDQGTPRTLPNAFGAFLNLSLIEDALNKLKSKRAGTRRPGPRVLLYRPFSAAGIRHATWDELGGLDERFIFCYEDADFTRRFVRSQGHLPAFPTIPLRHAHSVSTKSRIAEVLPAIAISSRTYMTTCGLSAHVATAIAVMALICRIPLVFFAKAPLGQHLHGIGRSLRMLATGDEPSMPDYAKM